MNVKQQHPQVTILHRAGDEPQQSHCSFNIGLRVEENKSGPLARERWGEKLRHWTETDVCTYVRTYVRMYVTYVDLVSAPS